MPVYLYIVMMFAFSILFVQDFNVVLVFISFYISSFSFLFSFSSGFLSRSHFRERLPNHFRSRFSFVHENNTAQNRALRDAKLDKNPRRACVTKYHHLRAIRKVRAKPIKRRARKAEGSLMTL